MFEEFRVDRLKICGNCAFPQNFHTRKLGEISVFYAVQKLDEVDSFDTVYAFALRSGGIMNPKFLSWVFWNLGSEV